MHVLQADLEQVRDADTCDLLAEAADQRGAEGQHGLASCCSEVQEHLLAQTHQQIRPR